MRGMLRAILILLFACGLARAQDEKLYLADRSEAAFYAQSHALVIGIRHYKHHKELKGAEKDARDITDALREQGFEVTSYHGQEMTGQQLRQAVEDFVAEHGYAENSRVLIWIAAHGLTVDGDGYLLGTDAPVLDKASADMDEDLRAFFQGSMPMRLFGIHLRQMRARHVMLVLDTCFSGTIFQNTRDASAVPVGTSAEMRSPTRQIITSGEEGQEVADQSVFAQNFIHAIRGEAVNGQTAHRPDRHYLTGTELGMFLYKTARMANQTPQFGKLPDVAVNTQQERGMFRTEHASYRNGEFFFRMPGAPEQPAQQPAPDLPAGTVAATAPAVVWMPLAAGTRIANNTPDPIPVFRSPPPDIGGRVTDLRAGEQFPAAGMSVALERAEIAGRQWLRFSSNGRDHYLPAEAVTIERP